MPKLLHSERGVWKGAEGFYLAVSDGDHAPPRFAFVKDEELILGWLSFDSQSLATRADDAKELRREGYNQPVRLSLEQGVTDPHDARAYTLNDPEAKRA